MLKRVQGLFCCPKCHNDLEWNVKSETDIRIVDADIVCKGCGRKFFVENEIAVFLIDVNNDEDLWVLLESNLAKALDNNPEYEERLMKSDVSTLNAADKLLRSMILDERGEYDIAKEVREQASGELYAPSYNRQYGVKKSQLRDLLLNEDGVIIDLASGMGGFAKMFQGLENPIVLSDISPSILQKNRERLQHFGLYDKVSLVAFDARKMPFKESSVPLFTSNMGLTNIRESETFVKELSRCLGGVAYLLTFFFPDNGDPSAQILEENKMDFGFEERLREISSPYLDTALLHPAPSEITPTVRSEIFEVGIDLLPVEPTTVKWAIVKFAPKTK